MNDPAKAIRQEIFWQEPYWKLSPRFWFRLGLGCLAFASLFDFLATRYEFDSAFLSLFSEQVVTIFFTVCGVASLAVSWLFLDHPLQIALSAEGLVIDFPYKQKQYGWEELGGTIVTHASLNDDWRVLVLFDRRGKRIATVVEDVTNFDRLTQLLREELDDRPADQKIERRMQLSIARRTATIVGCLATAFLVMVGSGFLHTAGEIRDAYLLKEKSIAGVAEIVKRYKSPNGRWFWLNYRITDKSGNSGDGYARLKQNDWERLEGETSVPVLYVPGRPEVNRVTEGEIPDGSTFTPFILLIISGLMSAWGLFILAGAVVLWFGWDVDWDRETKKISVKRFSIGD